MRTNTWAEAWKFFIATSGSELCQTTFDTKKVSLEMGVSKNRGTPNHPF